MWSLSCLMGGKLFLMYLLWELLCHKCGKNCYTRVSPPFEERIYCPFSLQALRYNWKQWARQYETHRWMLKSRWNENGFQWNGVKWDVPQHHWCTLETQTHSQQHHTFHEGTRMTNTSAWHGTNHPRSHQGCGAVDWRYNSSISVSLMVEGKRTKPHDSCCKGRKTPDKSLGTGKGKGTDLGPASSSTLPSTRHPSEGRRRGQARGRGQPLLSMEGQALQCRRSWSKRLGFAAVARKQS